MKNKSFKKPLFIKSNKGIAIEMVIVAALVVFGLCSLIMVYTFKSMYLSEYNARVLQSRLDLDQIGDDYLNYLNGNSKSFDVNGYSYELKDEKFIYTIIIDKGTSSSKLTVYDLGLPQLTINYNYDNYLNKYIITGWIYGG